EEAVLAFGDDDYQVQPDDLHSGEEDRFIIVGMSPYGHLLTIAYALRGEDTVRIISARNATSRERRTYEEKKRS
ncbi:MAG TPA: BrnT family toxin, partial [Thermoanaerobaculia bacterium]|nr:BrnT family toxin [Thermoanaerobaculia bacterium]